MIFESNLKTIIFVKMEKKQNVELESLERIVIFMFSKTDWGMMYHLGSVN